MKIRFASCFFALLLFSTVLGLETQLEVVESEATPGEMFEYRLRVINDEDVKRDISISVLTLWQVSVEPSEFSLAPGESEISRIKIYVPIGAEKGRYYFIAYLRYDEKTDQVLISGSVIFEPFYKIRIESIEVPEEIDPREKLRIKLNITNEYGVTNVDLIARLIDRDGIIRYSKAFTRLIQVGENIVYLELDLDPKNPPQEFDVVVDLEYHLVSIGRQRGRVRVKGYHKPSLVRREEVSIFGRSVLIVLANEGTLEIKDYPISERISPLERFLIIGKSEGVELIGDELRLVIKSLAPGAEQRFEYRVTYLPLLAIPFILIAICFTYWYLTRILVASKFILEYQAKEGVLSIKIGLAIKNVSRKEISDVRIVELVPVFAKEIGEFGTIEGKVSGKERTRKVTWQIEKMDGKEEILLSYQIQARIEIIGTIYFPPAVVSFKDRKGKTYQRKSNPLTLEVIPEVIAVVEET
jgi:hypothetical protein